MNFIGPGHPPLRAFAARHIELKRTVGLCSAIVHADAPAGNHRPGAVVNLPARFILIEPQVQETAQEISRLRKLRKIGTQEISYP